MEAYVLRFAISLPQTVQFPLSPQETRRTSQISRAILEFLGKFLPNEGSWRFVVVFGARQVIFLATIKELPRWNVTLRCVTIDTPHTAW